jgi:hypothetical protein
MYIQYSYLCYTEYTTTDPVLWLSSGSSSQKFWAFGFYIGGSILDYSDYL